MPFVESGAYPLRQGKPFPIADGEGSILDQCTIGSTNIANRSFYRDTELNASFWHQGAVRALRVELLREHLGLDTAGTDDREALRLYRDVARANRSRRTSSEPLLGLAYAIDSSEYGS